MHPEACPAFDQNLNHAFMVSGAKQSQGQYRPNRCLSPESSFQEDERSRSPDNQYGQKCTFGTIGLF